MVFTNLVIILHPRIGGPATAAVIANGIWGMVGFTLSIVTLHLTALPLGSAAALGLALAVAVSWNLGWWTLRRLRARAPPTSS